ncbi:uncharacterized protein LOC100159750 isoform X2 [Acyrthosiphon pisum]|uniref:ACYPI001099 protein n=1 Tax=Acyrthosiphon pisum TaxID=7029 RepID=A0A8R2B5I4_ACYPI|nr:uncharacterized protein LOC100159750 isoform X2 [Acyrthosiphon pisum]|eukprot:XP_008182706.1 PREDICTED: uncharacterized protein LOC100159750 isoform X1 [Acyrthosiphon pisum]
MFKHIIVLVLCFMAYFVGNLDATIDENIAEFNKLAYCYKQMFEEGLIKDKTGRIVIFEDILINLYGTCRVKFEYENQKPVIQSSENNETFKLRSMYNDFKMVFIDEFVQIPDQEFLQKVETKIADYKKNGHNENDLMVPFVNHYNANSNQEIYTSVSAYCLDYMTKLRLTLYFTR